MKMRQHFPIGPCRPSLRSDEDPARSWRKVTRAASRRVGMSPTAQSARCRYREFTGIGYRFRYRVGFAGIDGVGAGALFILEWRSRSHDYGSGCSHRNHTTRPANSNPDAEPNSIAAHQRGQCGQSRPEILRIDQFTTIPAGLQPAERESAEGSRPSNSFNKAGRIPFRSRLVIRLPAILDLAPV